MTASVDRIVLWSRPPLEHDLRYSGGVEWVGSSSMSVGIRVDYDASGPNGPCKWIPVLESRFTMVARDRFNQTAAAVNPLEPATAEEREKHRAASIATALRRQHVKTLKEKEQRPPTTDELTEVHQLFRRFPPMDNVNSMSSTMLSNTNSSNSSSGNMNGSHGMNAQDGPVEMALTGMTSTLLMHPQNRNIHGKVFGGYLMRQAFEQAFSAAYLFGRSPPKFSAVEEIAFIAPVEVGSLLQFSSKIVYTRNNNKINDKAEDKTNETKEQASSNTTTNTNNSNNNNATNATSNNLTTPKSTVMVETKATVVDPISRSARTTNVFLFTFDLASNREVIPRTYHEALGYVRAKTLLANRSEVDQKIASKL